MASDLDEELLAAAGCTGKGMPLKRRIKDYQDSDGDSPEEYEEEEEEIDKDDESYSPSSRSKGLDMATGRRRRASYEDDEDDEGEDSISSLSFGEDLYGDAKDRERLESMKEVDREMIFLERGERLQEYKNRKLKKSQEQAEKARRSTRAVTVTPPPLTRRASMASTPSGRSRVLPGRREKAEILSNLVALKQSKTRDSALKKRRMFDAGIHTPPSDGDEEDDGTQSHSVSHANEDDEEVESGKSSPEAEMTAKEDLQKEVPADQLSFTDITDITIRRSKLAKWLTEPYFEKTVVGCFVRLAVGSDSETGYRLCQVAAIEVGDPSRSYKLDNRRTHKHMSCLFGSKVFTASMLRVSDQPPKEEEFEAWKEVVVEDLSVYKELVADKAAAISKVGNFVYSADTVKRMIEEKKKNAARPFNLAAEKDRVIRELALAEHELPCDMAKIGQLQAQLKQLEALGAERRVKDAKAIALAEMNRRNREENFRNASQRRALDAGQDGYDPFSRRWTRSQNYYSKGPASTPALAPASMPAQAELLVVPVPAAEQDGQQEAAETGKLVNTAPPSKQVVQLHRFELPIDLSRLQKFGSGPTGAALAYLSNRQRLEGVFGHPVTMHDSHAHPHTLSMNDYKRRMNLID